MKLDYISIFCDFFSVLRHGVLGRANQSGILDFGFYDLRSYADGPRRSVDDAPYGGGAGMVMMAEPWARAIEDAAGLALRRKVLKAQMDPPAGAGYARQEGSFEGCKISQKPPTIVFLSAFGKPLNRDLAKALAEHSHIIFACGRYEGIDERVFEWSAERYTTIHISIGDYVLCGGESAAIVATEALCRFIPGVLGNSESLECESYEGNTLEGPVYTRPAVWRGMAVPQILLSGDHAKVNLWNAQQSKWRTQQVRPDMDLPS